MADVMTKDGTWTFDGETIRIVPGQDRGVHRLRRVLGEIAVPLAAVARASYAPGRKAGRLQLRLRTGADPFLQVCGGRLQEDADPYQLTVENDRAAAAEYFAEEIRNALLLEGVPDTPTDRYLLPAAPVPLGANGQDGSAAFDGETVRLEWNWIADERKRATGTQRIPLAKIVGVEWHPAVGLDSGHLRFRVDPPATGSQQPQHDPYCLQLWGLRKETGTSALLAAAVVARLPHPNAPRPEALPAAAASDSPSPSAISAPGAPAAAESTDDHDVVLRRLRELGDLHRDGILDADEFAAAKAALLRRL
ncbi:DUF4429 domain-containing protein [Yinghuangia soli]|uniref:DUF4429 domain-containing protein n=1 Tax=Yinghuangia soli TaxID=2908204 RepID=A0AA41Q769_9ACTN|nr:DUF4429 domain-containing protein [Yinghuangia soli]MCF2531609.1 DUF4429 domain-containing protein [Yinghuangia soli]